MKHGNVMVEFAVTGPVTSLTCSIDQDDVENCKPNGVLCVIFNMTKNITLIAIGIHVQCTDVHMPWKVHALRQKLPFTNIILTSACKEG